MHLRRQIVHLTACLLCAFGSVRAQNPWAPPVGLRVVFVDVGQGDATIVVGPSGIALLVDAGPTGQGVARVIPELKRLGVTRLTHVVLSHYHIDHMGGMPEVFAGLPVDHVWDRGTRDEPSIAEYRAYVNAAGTRRRVVSTGQVLDLGGGAIARVLAFDGNVLGLSSQLPIRNTYQQENAASVVLRIEYGDFSMWLGGDLTGGGNNTYDCESKVAAACGDVDVYKADHHGSSTSSNASLVGLLDPEVAVGSNGTQNPFYHPSTSTINRLNTKFESRLFLDTTEGYGYEGYTQSGTTTITTDGFRYRVVSQRGDGYDIYTDESVPFASKPSPGELVISELMRAPTASRGQYLEFSNRSPRALCLDGVKIEGNLGFATLATPYRLMPGEAFTVVVNGITSKNGGITWGHALPYKSFSLGSAYDTLRLSVGTTTLDTLSYSTGFPGSSGVAAERIDALGPTIASNFAAATRRYAVDFGSPGAINSVDATTWPLGAHVEVVPNPLSTGRALHTLASGFSSAGAIDVAALSFGNQGIRIGSTIVPLSLDALFTASFEIPGFVSILPTSGEKGIRIPVPPGLTGKTGYFAHFLLSFAGGSLVPATSNAARFDFP
ncbi:MAG: MBL fold metallo-hydrolase [Planctomycetes bacterium]|nr:MBL fold metallo-hydrolase [Planctomycetota bacterium]